MPYFYTTKRLLVSYDYRLLTYYSPCTKEKNEQKKKKLTAVKYTRNSLQTYTLILVNVNVGKHFYFFTYDKKKTIVNAILSE